MRPESRLSRRPDGVDDATIEAVGKPSEALEWVERARGRLYDFHQMMGHADSLAEEAGHALAAAGHQEFAEMLCTEVVGRNVLDGRWTFQIVEEFDDTYYSPFVESDRTVRDALCAGQRHVYESELKESRRTAGLQHHELAPGNA